MDSISVADLPDPRVWPAPSAAGVAARLHALAGAAIAAPTHRDAELCTAQAAHLLAALMSSPDANGLVSAFEAAPSVAIARHLWQLLADCERGPAPASSFRTTLVALPVILVTALDRRPLRITQSGVVPDAPALEALLRDAGEFGGLQTFALSPTLVGADAIDLAALPRMLAGCAAGEHRQAGEIVAAATTGGERASGRPDGSAAIEFAPAPFDAHGANEQVHLRFIVGAVLTAPSVDPVSATTINRWGLPFSQALARQLAASGLSILALPRPPQRFVPALRSGRAAQRDVSAQLFASNAIRKLRSSVGEPSAIISAHRAAGAPGGGELRMSLSSPFAPRAAEGFRCPLHPYEPVRDVAETLVGLLRDCRVTDIVIRPGVHADVDPVTGGPLLFKATEIESAAPRTRP